MLHLLSVLHFCISKAWRKGCTIWYDHRNGLKATRFWFQGIFKALLWIIDSKSNGLKLKCLDDLYITIHTAFRVVWIACGLLWCYYQLFGLSFWRHPFTAEDPKVSKWCNANEETNSTTSWMAWRLVNIQKIFTFGKTILLSSLASHMPNFNRYFFTGQQHGYTDQH